MSISPSTTTLTTKASSKNLFQPSICKKSLRIAKNLKSSKERLIYTPEKKIEQYKLEFKPVINNNSIRILKKTKKNTQKVWESLYENSIEQRIKLENARKISKIDKEDTYKECTFKPIIINNEKISTGGIIKRNYS